jgi:superfamily II DNA/RNA helicase
MCKYGAMNKEFVPGLAPEISAALQSMGYESPTYVQTMAIPPLLAGEDLFMQSETGTGKTFAYLAPAISQIREARSESGPLVLVLCPTQELAVQVARQAELLIAAAGLSLTVASLLGGSPLSRQESALKKKPHLVIGTPGRIGDLVQMRSLRLGNLRYLILDEGDRLFSKEYRESAVSVLAKKPASTCVALASATLLESTRKSASPYMKNPRFLDLYDAKVLAGDIEHWIFYVEHRKKIDFIRKLENALKPKRCLVFASSTDRVAKIVERLERENLPVDSLLSRQEKEHRRVALDRFESGKLRYLVTTDLGARGLDIVDIDQVINIDLPEESSWYIHRAGRTARAGKHGVSIVLADGVELNRASKVAVERGFVFRTKVLSEGIVYEPPVEEFFALVEEGEKERRDFLRQRGT